MTPALRRARVVLSLAFVVAIACGASWDRITAPTSPLAPPSGPARSASALSAVTSQSNTKLCATVSGGAFQDGTPVVLQTCNGSAAQKWTATSEGEYRANGLPLCLDTKNASSVDGTIAFIWTCYKPSSQDWTLTPAGELRRADGKCLEPLNSRMKSGTALVIYPCANRPSQQWTAPAAPVDTTTPPPPPPPPPTGIAVLPGQSIQAAVDANPTGTTFLLKSGTHVRQTIAPKTGDVFIGETGTVLDGQNATPYAFTGYNGTAWVNDVTIKKIAIMNYAPPSQMGAIRGGDHDRVQSTSGWVLDSLDVHHNANLGVRIGNRMQVLRSTLHHNGTINIGGVGVGIVVDGTEVAYGNDGCPNDPGFEAGGSKFAVTDSLIVRNSFFHHNCGPGLWLDTDNRGYVLENNRVEDNAREGIVVEISSGGVVRTNTVRRNGWPVDPYRGNGWGWDAGIGVHASSDVEVYGNTLDENFNGIVALQQNRGSGAYGPYLVQNLYVHDNTVTQRNGGYAGAAMQDVGDTAMFTSRNNRWVHNTYFLGTTNTRPFEWSNGMRTAAEWRAYGQDVTGLFNP